MGGVRSLAAPARPVRLGGIPFSQSPFRGGLSGNGMLPVFFAASATPSRGVWGTKLWPFFSSIFDPGHKTPNLASDDLVQNVLNLIKKTGLAAYLGSEEAS